MLFLLYVSAALALAPVEGSFATFSSHHARSDLQVDVTIGTKAADDRSVTYWVSRVVRRRGSSDRTSETDSQSCPVILTLLRSLRDLPLPRPSVPLLDTDTIIVTADGVDYRLIVPASYDNGMGGQVTLQSNVGTPLADWVEQANDELDKCVAPIWP